MNSPVFSYSDSFLELLSGARASIMFSSHQANRVGLIYEHRGKLSVDVIRFARPTGFAFIQDRVVIATENELIFGRHIPAVIPRLSDQKDRHDSCYVIQKRFATGNLDIHEMAWTDDELWFINTRFSCLCIWDGEHSFVPKWKPRFVTEYAAEDRCHLNGLALENDQPTFVTAFGHGNSKESWRESPKDTGVIVNLNSGDIIASGLNMPHSPRWHEGQLWFIQSGAGWLCRVNVDSGAVEHVTQLPGFGRGMTFFGRYALIGLSKGRPSSRIGELTEHEEWFCGIVVVDLNSGKLVGALRFEDAIEELFNIELLGHTQHPALISLESHPEVVSTLFTTPTV